MNQLVRTTVISEADFLRRKNNKLISKEKRIKTLQLTGVHVFILLAFVAGAAFFAYTLGDFLLSWEKLNVTSIKLATKPTYKIQQVRDTLTQYLNTNILTIDFSDLRHQLLQYKEVKDVALSRNLPGAIEVKFFLRKPVFQVAIDGKYNIIDMEGVVLNTSNQSSPGLIEIKGVDTAQLEQLAPYLPELSRIKGSIDFIGLQKPYGVTLKLKGQKEIFYPGENNFASKINYYLKLREKPLLRHYNIKSVDLRFKDRFYFEYETEVLN